MKNNTPIAIQHYVALILLQLLLPIFSAVIDMFDTAPQLKLLDQTLYTQPQMWEILLITLLGFFILVMSIGLLLRQHWARKLYLYSFFPLFLIYFMPYMQWFYMSHISALLNDLSFVFAGMLWLILWQPNLYQPLFAPPSVK